MKAYLASLGFGLIALAICQAALNVAQPDLTSHRTERLGALCEAGLQESCDQLVKLTKGQCAGPAWSGCRFGLALRQD